MRCPICGIDIKHLDKERVPCGHLFIVKSAMDAHVHVHGDIDNKPMMQEFLEIAKSEIKISDAPTGNLKYKEIIFHNRQRIGDMIMFTCAIRDFKALYPDIKVGVVSTAMHVWDNNPYITPELCLSPGDFEALMGKDAVKEVSEDRLLVRIGPSKGTNQSNRIDWHFANAFRISMEDALKIHIPQGESRGDIWFSEEEYNAPRITERPYWIIITGGERGWGCKMYPTERWQKFVEQNPDILFYQLGSLGDKHERLRGANVVDYIGKTENRDTGLRDLFRLFLNAEGSIGLVSFHMHLSGALKKPAIVVAGAREPVSFTRYEGHRYLSTDGCLPCGINACWHCNIDTCESLVVGKEKVPKCVDLITPEDLTRALSLYYTGGRLRKDAPSEKPKLKNIVKTPVKIKAIELPKADIVKYGMAWGGGCITEPDWEFMQSVIKEYGVKSVLEFGAGLSSLLMNDLGLQVATYETMPGWIEKIRSINPNLSVQAWDGKTELSNYAPVDMVFVDGPAGGINREVSTRIASRVAAKVVIIHDAGREWERKWQEMYLKPGFTGPGKGGSRCHLWVKNGVTAPKLPDSKPVLSVENAQTPPREVVVEAKLPDRGATGLKTQKGKFIKVVSTARGWGGCARSITTIMRFLVQAGHRVEFIPFRNKVGSREFTEFLRQHPDIRVTESYDTIRESCDVLFMYADDYIWEFGQPAMVETFSDLNAAQKVMMLNYRRGGVGEVAWTRGWDKYMFLNSNQETELLRVHPGVKTKVLPPCTELDEFLKAEPNYEGGLRIVRHNSQGDTKFIDNNYPADMASALIRGALSSRPDVSINMLPGPSFFPVIPGAFTRYPRTDKPEVIANFLQTGNLFWYSLPPGYMDMGPRVILEAMAAGLPILADNWGGAVDRVTPECGWLCDTKEQMVSIIGSVTMAELEKKGKASRNRAVSQFIPARWIGEVVNA